MTQIRANRRQATAQCVWLVDYSRRCKSRALIGIKFTWLFYRHLWKHNLLGLSSHTSANQHTIERLNLAAERLSLTTFAQIIDGLPISDVAWDQDSAKLDRRHPINDHVALCSGALETAEEFRAGFDLTALRFNPTVCNANVHCQGCFFGHKLILTCASKLLQAYQSATILSRTLYLRLAELVAVTIHQIGTFLFRLRLDMHDPDTTRDLDTDTVMRWEPDQNPSSRAIPDPSLFTQPNFTALGQYPDGLSDMVGYWAEDRVLGGVFLFDRSRTWLADGEPNMYIQCCRRNVTYRVCQLLDEQQDSILNFLRTMDTSAMRSPFPILPGADNRSRIEPADAISIHQVYRDNWERSPPRRRLRTQQYGPGRHQLVVFPRA